MNRSLHTNVDIKELIYTAPAAENNERMIVFNVPKVWFTRRPTLIPKPIQKSDIGAAKES